MDQAKSAADALQIRVRREQDRGRRALLRGLELHLRALEPLHRLLHVLGPADVPLLLWRALRWSQTLA